jgi:branched-subunit amino acid aminotransferase/4-amino-4-deoxychorismate lyase
VLPGFAHQLILRFFAELERALNRRRFKRLISRTSKLENQSSSYATSLERAKSKTNSGRWPSRCYRRERRRHTKAAVGPVIGGALAPYDQARRIAKAAGAAAAWLTVCGWQRPPCGVSNSNEMKDYPELVTRIVQWLVDQQA